MPGTTPHRPPRDAGAAMVITIMVVALVTILTATILVVTVNNLLGARSARDAASALNAADAGVSQAIAYIRSNGVKPLDCSPTCAANPWGNAADPARVELSATEEQSYETWIEPVAPFPDNNPALYTIHSTGYASTGVRSIEVDISLGSLDISLPTAVYARSVNGGGSASVARESIITTGCVSRRDQIATGGIDAALGIPVGVHSSRYISTRNSSGNTQNCSSDSGNIHAAGACNPAYPYDQSASGGGPLAGGCAGAMTYDQYYASRDLDGNGTVDVHGSYIRDDNALRKLFNVREKPFTDSELDELRSVAQAQGFFFTTAAGYTSPDPTITPNAVMYFDLDETDPGGMVDLNNVTGWGRAKNLSGGSASCTERSLIIIIEGGNARLNSNQVMAATLVMTSSAPYGEVTKANGTADFIGTIFADTLNMVGNLDVSLDECFMANISPSLLGTSITEVDYREIDRTD